MKLNPAANQNGVAGLNHDTKFGSDNFPPMYGPIIKPNPNAAPMKPKFRARVSGLEMSAIAACATEMLPPVIPSNALDANKSGIFRVIIPIANVTYEIQVPVNAIASTFFLPNLSDSWPSMGVARNCMNGYDATKNPSKIYPCWIDIPEGKTENEEFSLPRSNGTTGIRIP